MISKEIRLLSLFLLLLIAAASSCYGEEEEYRYEDWDKNSIPPGMEVQKVGDLKVLVPENSKMRKVGDLLVVENMSEYFSRKYPALEEKVNRLEAEQDKLKAQLKQIKDGCCYIIVL